MTSQSSARNTSGLEAAPEHHTQTFLQQFRPETRFECGFPATFQGIHETIKVRVLTGSILGAIYRDTTNLSRFLMTASAVALLAVAGAPARAAELQFGGISAFSASTMGYLDPAGSPVLGLTSVAADSSWAQSFDGYSAPVFIGRVGVFGAYDQQRQSLLSLNPASSWNFGATVGYAGFYVRGGVNETAPLGPLLGLQGLQAGFGYEIGSFDVRLTYAASQGLGLAERAIDSRQWTIGGIYQITPRIRVNADAFYGEENRGTSLSAAPTVLAPPPASPPGTGARVGVQLRF